MALVIHRGVEARFLLGPAGSGKTCHCLAEIRRRLAASPEGPPLVLLAPKQATFQLERQLLSTPEIAGYTRLQVLSFERLAQWILAALQEPTPAFLTAEGRIMVLRALLMRHLERLELFHASARLPGFARDLSDALREFQQHGHAPSALEAAARQWPEPYSLARKLRDMALLGRAYEAWLSAKQLLDAESLLDLATTALRQRQKRGNSASPASSFQLEGLWMDGFAELTSQELNLLGALLPFCQEATLAFCLEQPPRGNEPWLSGWSHVSQICSRCWLKVQSIAGQEIHIQRLSRETSPGRFAQNATLRYLEENWLMPSTDHRSADPHIADPLASPVMVADPQAIQIVVCPEAEAEAVVAAREIRRFVRLGARYRDCAVLLRRLEGYHEIIRRVFARYEIPCFLDRRESVAHHPLAELTRHALRVAAYNWRAEDWFGALKTGLAGITDEAIDEMENEALARGWEGDQWSQPIRMEDNSDLQDRLEDMRLRLMPPFAALARRLGHQPSGELLAESLRLFWDELKVGQTLADWGGADAGSASQTVHATVWLQMQTWLANLALGFPADALSLRDWLPIVEAGLAGLTVGIVPPALDQVLIGAVDRSRNPDLKLVVVLGLNESVFPTAPARTGLLSEADRDELAGKGLELGDNLRAQLGRERYLGYIAFTRARERLVLTYSRRNLQGQPLNPSPFLNRFKAIFADLPVTEFPAQLLWPDAEHPCELVAPLVSWLAPESPMQRTQGAGNESPSATENVTEPRRKEILSSQFVLTSSWLEQLPGLARLETRLRGLAAYVSRDDFSAAQAGRLYGRALRASVSQLEDFAACPFKFFIQAGLRGQERQLYELEAREIGRFQHALLARFHEEVTRLGKRWRDLDPAQAREIIRQAGETLTREFDAGLMQANPLHAFRARNFIAALQDFIQIIIGWMAAYQLDPRAVELAFGADPEALPPWELDLGQGASVALRGRIDRADLWVDPSGERAAFVIIDYKFSKRTASWLFMENGVELQLPAYLNMLRHSANARARWGVSELIPAGAFYVGLRAGAKPEPNRLDAMTAASRAGSQARQHRGVFDLAWLPQLDQTHAENPSGQFMAKFTKEGKPHKTQCDGAGHVEFDQLLGQTEQLIAQFGRRILEGDARVDPYQHGRNTPCADCQCRFICRIDPWAHSYRKLVSVEPEAAEPG